MTPHPILERAAAGELPAWAEADEPRRRHIERVGALLGAWADELGLPDAERARWLAVGALHDALRDAPPETLRPRVPPALARLPGRLLHGPAAAERLRIEGVADGELLRAVGYHTLGHPSLGRLGQALYAADFLEPGRELLDDWRAELRARMPGELSAVAREILRARIVHLVERGSEVRPETVGFWNALASGNHGGR
jgi:2-amino-4-hydroxy-6-hydroxymethyldihydropteridine diphosphokinase